MSKKSNYRLNAFKYFLLGTALFFGVKLVSKTLPSSVEREYELAIIAVIVVAAFVFAPRLFRLAWKNLDNAKRKEAPDGFDVLANDLRPYFLYLRSFDIDSKRPVHGAVYKNTYGALSPQDETYEQQVIAKLNETGPVVAVGEPGTHVLPPLGAGRFYFDDSEWKERVLEMMRNSYAVIFRIQQFESEGLIWEFQNVLTSRVGRIIVIIPLCLDEKAREGVFTAIRRYLPTGLRRGLPETIHDCIVIAIKGTSAVKCFSKSVGLLDTSEQKAVGQALLYLEDSAAD